MSIDVFGSLSIALLDISPCQLCYVLSDNGKYTVSDIHLFGSVCVQVFVNRTVAIFDMSVSNDEHSEASVQKIVGYSVRLCIW